MGSASQVKGEHSDDLEGEYGILGNLTTGKTQSADFFISYTASDVAWATWVGTELEAAGHRVRLQTWDAPAGKNFVTWIDEQIRDARWTIALCSPEYVRSPWCIQEWTGALSEGKVIPLRIADCALPPTLATIGWRDLHGQGEDAARHALLQAVGDRSIPRVASGGFPGVQVARTLNVPFPGIFGAWNVPGRLASFTGREKSLDRINSLFDSAESNGRIAVVQTAALHGLGGVGKSQLAIEYAHRHADNYDIVWWVDAEQTALIGDQLADLGLRLGLASVGKVNEDAAATLEVLRRRERWLLIFDNASDASSIRQWLPTGAGNVLLTSRSPRWGQTAKAIAIDVFDRAESIALLTRRVEMMPETTAEQLAVELGDLPLALEQAAAYLEQTFIGPEAFLERFLTQRRAMLAKGYDLAYGGTVDTCWTMAVQSLNNDTPAASILLEICCQFASEPVPLNLFYSYSNLLPHPLGPEIRNAPDPLAAVDDLVAELLKYSLVGRIGEAIIVHRLVAAVVRAHRPEARDMAQRLLAAATTAQPEDPMNWPEWIPLAMHLLAAPALHPESGGDIGEDGRKLLFNTGRYLFARGDYRAALDLDRALYERCSQLLPSDHPHTLAAANNLAMDLDTLGEHLTAKDLNEDTLERMRRTLGEDHPDTLACANNLAVGYRALGEYEFARQLDQDTLARKQRILGPDHPHTQTSASNLAIDLRALGDHQGSRMLHEELLERRRRLLGEDFSHTLITARNLAADLWALGLDDAARSLEEDTIERRRRAFSGRHVHTLVSGENLARDLHALGEHQSSRELDEDTFNRSRHMLGDEHLQTLISAGNLARDLHAVGELRASRILNEETLARSRRLLGDKHPYTIALVGNLARDLHALGDHEKAQEWEEFVVRHSEAE